MINQFINEIQAANNSFLLELRIEMNWNVEKFYGLITLFDEYVQLQDGKTELNREVAAGVYMLHELIIDFVNHSNQKSESIDYYQKCLKVFETLIFHYFNGTAMVKNVEEMIENIKTA